MKRNRLWASLVLVALTTAGANAFAAYAEQWISPQQLKQEETRSSHRKSAYICASHAAHCQAAGPMHQLAGKHASPPRLQKAKNDLR
jgi:hypothetical protein